MARTEQAVMLIACACVIALAACSSGKKSTSPSSTKSAASKTTPVLGQLQRGLVEARSRASTPPLLVNVTTQAGPDYDRITFEFRGDGFPGYRVEYFPPPTQCASGEAVPIAGSAFLKVAFTANAHDDQGAPTLSQTALAPALTTLAEAKQTCDFEGEVSWTLGLNSVVDFRVLELESLHLAVDVAHP